MGCSSSPGEPIGVTEVVDAATIEGGDLSADPRPRPGRGTDPVLQAFIAFYTEHRRCGVLDVDEGRDHERLTITLRCSCGGQIANIVTRPPG